MANLNDPFYLLGFAVASGFVLVAFALRGKRVGGEPRCKECEYNLLGLLGDKCPECGAEVGGNRVVYGLRRRRRGMLSIGIAFVALGLSGFGMLGYGRAKNVNWYTYLPPQLLLHHAAADDPRAIIELVRRVKKGLLSDEHMPSLVDLVLKKQGENPAPRNARRWYERAAILEAHGVFQAEDRSVYFEQLVPTWMALRKRIRVGDPVVIRIAGEDRGSRIRAYELMLEDREILVHGRTLRRIKTRRKGYSPINGTESIGETIYLDDVELAPGTHSVEYVAQHTLKYYGKLARADVVAWSTRVHHTATVEVLPEDDDPVKLLDVPSLATELASILTVRSATLGYAGIRVVFVARREVPIGIAFEVFVLVSDEEHRLGGVSWKQGESGERGLLTPYERLPFNPDEIGSEVLLILRSSRAVAIRSLDLYTIWDGELRLEPVAVRRVKRRTRTSTGWG